jgi:hypothetical protein
MTISRYPKFFEEAVGCIPVSLRLRDKGKPIFHKEREVPYALSDKVNKKWLRSSLRELFQKLLRAIGDHHSLWYQRQMETFDYVLTTKSVSMQIIQFDGLITSLIVSETQNTSCSRWRQQSDSNSNYTSGNLSYEPVITWYQNGSEWV